MPYWIFFLRHLVYFELFMISWIVFFFFLKKNSKYIITACPSFSLICVLVYFLSSKLFFLVLKRKFHLTSQVRWLVSFLFCGGLQRAKGSWKKPPGASLHYMVDLLSQYIRFPFSVSIFFGALGLGMYSALPQEYINASHWL